jgi:hypothetical protein
MRSVSKSYKEENWGNQVSFSFVTESRVYAGSNTSTVALRVVGGDEKGTQSLRV